MDDRIKVGYYIARGAQSRLRALAGRDHRSLSGEIAWLIDREWQRHVAQLRARRQEGREARSRAVADRARADAAGAEPDQGERPGAARGDAQRG